MPTPAVIINILDQTGHLRYPDGIPAANVPAVGDPSYPTSLTDPRVVSAVQSYQRMHSRQLEPLIAKHYPNRTSPVVNADGQVGPATEELFSEPRCQCPDYTANTFGTSAALGAGGWKECHQTTGYHCAKIWEANQPPDHIKPHWAEIKKRFIAAEARHGFRVMFVSTKSEGNVSLTWVGNSDGWIGLATVGNRAETCQTPIDHRWMQLLGTYTQGWSDVARKIHAIVLLMMHEFGHVQSLQHVNTSIMSPFLDESRPENFLGVGDSHENTMRTMFGGKEYVDTSPPPITPPGPTPPPGTGTFPYLKVTDERTGKSYRLHPEAEV